MSTVNNLLTAVLDKAITHETYKDIELSDNQYQALLELIQKQFNEMDFTIIDIMEFLTDNVFVECGNPQKLEKIKFDCGGIIYQENDTLIFWN